MKVRKTKRVRDYSRLREKKEAGRRDAVYSPGLDPGRGFSFDFLPSLVISFKKNKTKHRGCLLGQLPNLIYRLGHIKYYFPEFDNFTLVM